MRHFCICISGFSGSGKDEIAKHLIKKYQAIQTGLADPMKRHMADIYGFTEEQLFGPSENRNKGDLRYPKNYYYLIQHGFAKPDDIIGPWKEGINYYYYEGRHSPDSGYPYIPLRLGMARIFVPVEDPNFWLSPREALQKYGQLMNELYLDIWVKHGYETHRKLACYRKSRSRSIRLSCYKYDRMRGLVKNTTGIFHEGDFFTCFSDFRHKNEINFVRNVDALAFPYEEMNNDVVIPEFHPVIIRIKRKGIESPPFQHRSELEQATIPDSAFDFIIQNDRTITDLYDQVDQIMIEVVNSNFQTKQVQV